MKGEMKGTPRRDEGGDPACWLGQVCAQCGRVREQAGEGGRCAYCGAAADGDRATAAERGRDRDTEGRARNARPRDGLGRPLPYGASGVARQPEGILRTPAESLAEAQQLLDSGLPFHAHEVLEDAWKAAPEPEQALWRGLAQLAVGLTHAARGNAKGGAALLRRGTENVRGYQESSPYAVDVAGLVQWARELAGRLESAGAAPVEPVSAEREAPRLCEESQ